MYYAIAVVVGVLLGVALSILAVRSMKSGVLKVYIPDDQDESPYLYVELTKSVGNICNRKQVVFTVDTRNLKTHQ